jgi:hypothetical protein
MPPGPSNPVVTIEINLNTIQTASQQYVTYDGFRALTIKFSVNGLIPVAMNPVGCGHTNPFWVRLGICRRLLTKPVYLVAPSYNVRHPSISTGVKDT